MDIDVASGQLRSFSVYLDNEVNNDFMTLLTQASQEGCNTSGFIGLLEPLTAAMGKLNDLTSDMYFTAVSRLASTSNGLTATADDYQNIDSHNATEVARCGGGAGPPQTVGIEGNIGTPYRNKTPIQARDIEPKNEPLGDVMEGDRWATDFVDWFYRNFISSDGMGLYDMLIRPIAGDFNRIKANGDAWGDVGEMLWNISGNMANNAQQLTTNSWKGNASSAFFQHVDVTWSGALFIASKCGRWMQKGFEKLADVCVKVATQCANLLQEILEMIGKLFSKISPWGPIVGAFEWVVSGFEKFPYKSDVEAIIKKIKKVQELHETIKQLVDSGKKYFEAFQKAADALKNIPEIDSVNSAVGVAKGYQEGVDDMRGATREFAESQQQRQEQVDRMGKS